MTVITVKHLYSGIPCLTAIMICLEDYLNDGILIRYFYLLYTYEF